MELLLVIFNLHHSRRGSKVFEDARYWFCPNFSSILAKSDHFSPNFALISPKFTTLFYKWTSKFWVEAGCS